MRRPSVTTSNNSRSAIKVLVVALIFGCIALALKPSIIWVKGQLLHLEGADHRASLKEQNRLNWCADVLESDSISESDYNYCKEFWKD